MLQCHRFRQLLQVDIRIPGQVAYGRGIAALQLGQYPLQHGQLLLGLCPALRQVGTQGIAVPIGQHAAHPHLFAITHRIAQVAARGLVQAFFLPKKHPLSGSAVVHRIAVYILGSIVAEKVPVGMVARKHQQKCRHNKGQQLAHSAFHAIPSFSSISIALSSGVSPAASVSGSIQRIR